MKNFLVVLALLAFTLTACGKDGAGTSPSIVSIAVTPASPDIHQGETRQFTATGAYSDNSNTDLTSSVTWTSSSSSVATVSSTGLATALNAGSTTITASRESTTGSTILTVTNVASDSPFGFHPAVVTRIGYEDNGYGDALNIGVKWTREGMYAYWFKIQPDINDPTHAFAEYDSQWAGVPAGMKILANIAPQGDRDENRCILGSYLPVDMQKYIDFVKATVDRYDGDGGSEDMPGLANPIKFWQVGNEPNGTRSDFDKLQQITYTAIKEACPDCTVLIGGVPGMPPAGNYIDSFDKQYAPILQALAGKYVDVLDFHWYGAAKGDYLGAKQVYNRIRSVLTDYGFPADLPIWITEMGAYSGDPAPSGLPAGGDFQFQTEREQALDYFKRFVYPLSFGVKKIFPAFGLMEGIEDGVDNDGYFNHTGLIYDGVGVDDLGLGVKKLGYYTYKKMTEVLEGSDWSSIEVIQESGDVYIYKVMKDGKEIYVAWWDYFNDPSYTQGKTLDISLAGLEGAWAVVTEVVPKFATGAEVTDYSTAFNTSMAVISSGSATLTLGDSPVLVEASPDTEGSPVGEEYSVDADGFIWGTEGNVNTYDFNNLPAEASAAVNAISGTLRTKYVKLRLSRAFFSTSDGGHTFSSGYCLPVSTHCTTTTSFDMDEVAQLYQTNGWSMVPMFRIDETQTVTTALIDDYVNFVDWFVGRYKTAASIEMIELVNSPNPGTAEWSTWKGTNAQLVELTRTYLKIEKCCLIC